MTTTPSIEDVLRQYAQEKVAALRNSVGGELIHDGIMRSFPAVERGFSFIMKCRVMDADIALHAGDMPLVRIRLRANIGNGVLHRTVSPSSWVEDILISFLRPEAGINVRDLARIIRHNIPQQRILGFEHELTKAREAVLLDPNKVNDVKVKLDRLREMKRNRQHQRISETIKDAVHDLTEEDVVQLYRRTIVQHILDS